MGYWPSYAGIDAQHRAGFLRWLADGRCDPDAYIGYVFLFFYGLERRILERGPGDADYAAGDVAPILAEVERLCGIYGGNGSFAGCAGGFLQFCRVSRTENGAAGEVRSGLFGWEIPADVRLDLGRYAADERPVPAELAFAWACNLPDAPRRTPAMRCAAEFRDLFAIRYEQEHGAGVMLKNRGKALSVSYRPASPGFSDNVEWKVPGTRDVTGGNGSTGKTLCTLAARCVDDLDAYSRWLGRNADGDGDAAPGVALLPAELLAKHGAPALADLRQWLHKYVPHDQPIVTGASEVLTRWRPAGPSKVKKSDATGFAVLLEKLGYGVEPDVRFGGPPPAVDGQIALFRLREPFSAPTLEYMGATTLLRFAALVAGADGVADAEARFLSDHVASVLGFGAGQRRRLTAHSAWLLSDPPSIAGLKKAAAGLTASQREDVGRLLVSVAGADGVVSPSEVRMLLKVFALLGLPEEAVYSQVHALGSSGHHEGASTMEPVVVRSEATPESRFGLPPRAIVGTRATDNDDAITLDMARVRAQMADSARVSAVLAEIFRGDEGPSPPLPPQTSVAGLDSLHSALLVRLSGTSSLARIAWEEHCEQLGVLPDGALDTINEAAFDRVGDPLLGGDDPIHVDPDVYRSLLA